VCPVFPREWYKSQVTLRLLRSFLSLAMALEEYATTIGMIKPDSSNYSLWKPMMEDIIFFKDFYEPTMKEKILTGVMEE
jgi:hypothetical protein